MELEHNRFYHIYNRSNNEEIVFKDRENYSYFLNKYFHYVNSFADTLAYCLCRHIFTFSFTSRRKKLKQSETISVCC